MKRMIYTTKFISVLVFIALMLAACNKDEWKDDVDAMVDGIVLEAKGFWVIGLLKVIVEAVKNIILNAQLESRLRNS